MQGLIHRPAYRFAALALMGGVLAGCGGGERPHPVEGQVVFKGGDVSKLEGGKVRFRSTADPNQTAVGFIAEDGTFEVGALQENEVLPGVPAGEYVARIEPPLDNDRQPRLGLIHPKHLDFEQSGLRFTVPTAGKIVIEVERPRR